ncbi:MAG: ABC transporter permease [Caldilineaceae bacterium]|nr:ABC transporter permease [Caldilineaceae bacterium]
MTVRYILRRVGIFFLIIWVASTINFLIPRLAPGDPMGAILGQMQVQGAKVENSAEIIALFRERFGLDDPLYLQYAKYMGALLRLDLGYSIAFFPAKVTDVIGNALPYTIGLLAVSTLITFTLGVFAGALLVWHATPKVARMVITFFMMLAPIPYYLLAIIFVSVLAFGLGLFPYSGLVSVGRLPKGGFDIGYILDVLYHSTLPALSIIIAGVGGWILGMRGMMVTVLGEDYLTLAEAKGLRDRRIFFTYAMRNAMLPQFTGLAISLGYVVSGATIVELIFSYPGMGYRLFQAINTNDFPMIQGITFFLVVSIAVAILVIDLIYPRLDPRITYTRR